MQSVKWLGSALVPWFVIWLFAPCESVRAITVESSSHEPNYRLTSDADDLGELTDGRVNRFPFWTKQDSVGWHNRSPVTLAIEVPELAAEGSGVLRFRVAKRTIAGVWPPVRIDAYAKPSSDGARHIGAYEGTPRSAADGRAFWISIPISSDSALISVVIHAFGNNLFIDEIEWESTSESGRIVWKEMPRPVADIRSDSISRLKEQLTKQAVLEQASDSALEPGTGEVVTWECSPWERLTVFPPSDRDSLATIQVHGFSDERETACIGVYSPHHSLALEVSGDLATEILELYRVPAVLAADGSLVFDAMVPLEEPLLRVEPGKSEYLLVEFDLRKMTAAAESYDLTLRDNGQGVSFDWDFRVQRVNRPNLTEKPSAIVWAYTTQVPIWANPEAVIADLKGHGVDIQVVPPVNIPLPRMDGSWDVSAGIRLKRDLDLLAGNDNIVLLALGWHPGRKPKWLALQNGRIPETSAELLRNWAHRLVQFIDASGHADTRWMLYPVDEPMGSRRDLLIEVVDILSDAEPELEFFVNPVLATPAKRLSLQELEALTRYVDLWGPNIAYVEKYAENTFSSNDLSFVTYHNPPYPAKTSSPWEHYRHPAWRAWKVGATGIGAWAYDDTQKSSAWDDFDGRVGDWAMVYEGQDGPISSRRWEAFREGLEDLWLLKTYSAHPQHDQRLLERARHLLDSRNTDYDEFMTIRRSILHSLDQLD